MFVYLPIRLGNCITRLGPPAGDVRDGAVEFVRDSGSTEMDEGRGEDANNFYSIFSILLRTEIDKWDNIFF